MKIQGSYPFNAPRDRVWDILNDPAVIERNLPGCESLTPTGEDAYEAVLKIGIGPIRGTYQAKLAITEKQPPESYSLSVEGSGKPGFAKGTGRVELREEGEGTTVTYEGDLEIGGMIARVGQRMVGSLSQRMAGDFFESISKEARPGE